MTHRISSSDSGTGLYFLIGFMGSGKSMLSKGIQQYLDVTSIEMDDEIEQTAGKTINEIFATVGEEGFRKLEQEVLHQLIDRFQDHDKRVLISTGGGAPCYFDNMEVMNQSGTTIFINPSIDRLASRLEDKNNERPLIKGKKLDEIREFIALNLEKRLPYYRKAHLLLNTIYDDKDLNICFLRDLISAGND